MKWLQWNRETKWTHYGGEVKWIVFMNLKWSRIYKHEQIKVGKDIQHSTPYCSIVVFCTYYAVCKAVIAT